MAHIKVGLNSGIRKNFLYDSYNMSYFFILKIGSDRVNFAGSEDFKRLVQFPENSILKLSTNFCVGVMLICLDVSES